MIELNPFKNDIFVSPQTIAEIFLA